MNRSEWLWKGKWEGSATLFVMMNNKREGKNAAICLAWVPRPCLWKPLACRQRVMALRHVTFISLYLFYTQRVQKLAVWSVARVHHQPRGLLGPRHSFTSHVTPHLIVFTLFIVKHAAASVGDSALSSWTSWLSPVNGCSLVTRSNERNMWFWAESVPQRFCNSSSQRERLLVLICRGGANRYTPAETSLLGNITLFRYRLNRTELKPESCLVLCSVSSMCFDVLVGAGPVLWFLWCTPGYTEPPGPEWE